MISSVVRQFNTGGHSEYCLDNRCSSRNVKMGAPTAIALKVTPPNDPSLNWSTTILVARHIRSNGIMAIGATQRTFFEHPYSLRRDLDCSTLEPHEQHTSPTLSPSLRNAINALRNTSLLLSAYPVPLTQSCRVGWKKMNSQSSTENSSFL